MERQETVLVVDDEESIRLLLHQTLVNAGYKSVEVGEASAALELLKNRDVDIALLDINMPGRSGMELLMDGAIMFPDTAAIMLTGLSKNEICIDCMRRGAYDYITKPFNARELLVRIEQALEKRKLRLDNKQYQQHLEDRVKEQSARISSAFLDAITALAQALEAKDQYTAGHSHRVASISETIARQMGLPDDDISKIIVAALVHDIGKIGIRESILNKLGRLTEEEFKHVCSHCDVGERILKPITQDDEILSMVRHHHERYNGTGYPDGIRGGTGISALLWSIIALADAYDAMTSDRPYRKAMTSIQALQEIEAQVERQFDPIVFKAFLKAVAAINPSGDTNLKPYYLSYSPSWEQETNMDERTRKTVLVADDELAVR